ncbi:hypothetical protein BC830DRAFT_1085078 [Chytriomyces sp. MP71]|nr:hypothetical protein BC830DRAFT_1085078 [Chytriomyces sp. MP71]
MQMLLLQLINRACEFPNERAPFDSYDAVRVFVALREPAMMWLLGYSLSRINEVLTHVILEWNVGTAMAHNMAALREGVSTALAAKLLLGQVSQNASGSTKRLKHRVLDAGAQRHVNWFALPTTCYGCSACKRAGLVENFGEERFLKLSTP